MHPLTRSRNLDFSSLESTLRSADRSVVLVPPWLLRSVLLADSDASGASLLTLRNKAHAIHRDRLAQLIEQKDLPLSLPVRNGQVVLLLVEPQEDWLLATPSPNVLREYWRLLYHARIYIAVKTCLQNPDAAAGLQDRIDRIGGSLFADARFVLQRERLVPPAADDSEVYARFAAVFLELLQFAPRLVPTFFAAIDDPATVRQALAGDLDPAALLRQTRPPGAADPTCEDVLDTAPDSDPPADAPGSDEPLATTDRSVFHRRATRAASVGNDVRAAILHQRAHQRWPRRATARDARANPHFLRFANRLTAALQLDDAAAEEWSSTLAAVLARAADSWRNSEARLLYDLQKVCIDSQREVYTLDALGWLVTFGRRPLRRPVPSQKRVLVCKHLRSAIGRLGKCRLEPAPRRRLAALLQRAVHHAENDLRDRLRPSIGEALDRSGLRPVRTVERVAREKLVEEFLDGIVQRGFARMSDLRDTLSRNQLKLHDLEGFRALLGGDQLLQFDRHLAKPLDGVYHAGEIYLRFFQRVSSLLFATPLGRIFTYYGLIPFGGAFIILEVLGRTVGKMILHLSRSNVPFDHPGALLLLGLFLLAMVNIPVFRGAVVHTAKRLGNGLKWLIVDWPGWPLCRRFLERIAASRSWRSVVRYGLKPLAVTCLAWWLLPADLPRVLDAMTLGSIYIASAVVLNSRVFRVAARMLAHATIVLWGRRITDVVTGLFRVIVRVFRVLLDRLERTLYAVDEWFRFRGGQGRASLVAKAVLGSLWGIVAYVLRFCITLLAEPQINPIKHFPVVTVSHKIILPTQPMMAAALRSLGLSKVLANTYATTIAFVIPGVFGFLAWELKENWRLYAANRSPTLHPVRMGRRGETFAQLLRPGLHSGTVPRAFARLRHAALQETTRRSQAALHKQQDALAHVREAVSRFLQRELAGLLNRLPAWRAAPIAIGPIDLSAARIRVTLECPSRGQPAQLAFEQHDGWIVAGIDQPGWMLALSCDQAAMLGLALLGLYQIAGVDLVREQIERLFAPLPVRWSIRGASLIVWTGRRFQVQERYSFKHQDPAPVDATALTLPQYTVPDLLLRRRLLKWTDWARFWDQPVPTSDPAQSRLAQAGASVLPQAIAFMSPVETV